jgi:hypothetical protein
MSICAARSSFAVVFLVLAASSARADDVVVEEAPRVVYAQRTAIEFTEVDVEGALVKPAAAYVLARSKVRFRNLIALRASFRPELVKSAAIP